MRHNIAFKTFLGLYIPLLVTGVIVAISINKGDLVLALNAYHQPKLDIFFKYFTYLGDGLFLLVLILSLFFIHKKKYALLFSVTGIGQLIVSFVFKKIVFGRTIRPAIHIGEHLLQFVEGVRVPWWYSFPSGHTITAFSTFFLIALLSRNWKVAVLCLGVAILVAFSRMYLVLHFLEDVVAGSLIGVLLTMMFYSLAKKRGYLKE